MKTEEVTLQILLQFTSIPRFSLAPANYDQNRNGRSSIRGISATTASADGDMAENKSPGSNWEFVHQMYLSVA
jgi:hypothetical protein